LNTATRGSRKEFPAVAVIVAESNQVTIYDGDDPDLPMWMVFNYNSGAIYYTHAVSCVSMLNGILTIGISSTYGVSISNFVTENIQNIRNTFGVYTYNGSIVDRNSSSGQTLDSANPLVNGNTNDVAMTVLPNAPIDAATGLPVPTIAVGTNSGVSVIKDDGTVVDITSGNNWYYTGFLTFDKDNFITSHVGNATGQGLLFRYPVPSSDLILNNADDNMIAGGNIYNASATPSLGNALGGLGYITYDESGIVVDAENNETKHFVKYLPNDADYSKSAIAYVSNSFNTGWMNGDIKLATLSDTDDTDVTGSDLVGSATLYATARITSHIYTAGSSTVGIDNDEATNNGYVALTMGGLTSGKSYVITAVGNQTYTPQAGGYNNFANIDGTTISIDASLQGTTTQQSITFTAGTSNRIYFYSGYSGGTLTYTWTLRLAEEDRSVNGNGLQVFGTVTKNPVATGADLVAYSGFSSSNYLQQPYNSDLDFGTGDFCYTWWANITSVPAYLTHFAREYHNGSAFVGSSIEVFTETSGGKLRIYLSDDGYSTFDVWNSSTVAFGVGWQHFAIVRTGNTVSTYINGTLDNSFTLVQAVASLDNANAKLYISRQANGGSPMTNGSLALFRISATAPSPEQIKKIYEDEKVLFQENAQATLYGSSDAVTALAYDDTTELLHVGTSAGRSDFQGLRRINNTTTAVGSAISASNGLIADD
jgi:hypothetical protein